MVETIICRAAVAMTPDQPPAIRTVQVRAPRADEIRIKMLATGVCHTDLGAITGHMPAAKFPLIAGHEGVGEVESVGSDVRGFAVGDRVMPLWVPACGRCPMCEHMSERTNVCAEFTIGNRDGDYFKFADGERAGETVHQLMGTGTFAEYTIVPQWGAVKIDPKAPPEKVCLLACGFSTGYGSSVNVAGVTAGSTVAVFGLGGVGLAAITGARAAGAKRIIAVDVNPGKEALALKLGATDFLNPTALPAAKGATQAEGKKRTTQDVIKEMTGGLGVDYSVECAGHAAAVRSALECINPFWGVSVVAGVTPGEAAVLPEDMLTGKTWKGAIFGGFKGKDIPRLVEAYQDGKLPLDTFVSHSMSLDEINTAFDLMKAGKSIRTVLTF
ncbi:alcohol dehydrogenase class III [Zopfochytrium polystomum]|nr:alcohol dehydrogenase class III [Zopfochytrium polystomum]